MAVAVNYPGQTGNKAENQKFFVLVVGWLLFIFGLVWLACYAVGILIPLILTSLFPNSDAAAGVSAVCKALVPILSVAVFIPFNAMLMVLMERRALALFTVRRGPCRVGPDGCLQTAADAVKLLLKEDITPRGADAAMFTAAPIIFFAPSIFGAVPLLAALTANHPLFQSVNIPTGIFYVLAASSIPVVGIVMGGWASNNKYSLVGGLRSAAQAVSYEIPLVLSLVTVCLLAGTLDVVEIAKQQAGGFLNWNILGGGAWNFINIGMQHGFAEAMQLAIPEGQSPITFGIGAVVLTFCTIGLFLLYITGACAEINRIPFDLPEAESELVSGYNTEYSGIKFAIFFLAEFTNLFIVSSIASLMFFGGGDNPIPQAVMNWWYPSIEKALANLPAWSPFDPVTFWAAVWILIKTYSLVFFAILIRGTLPRFRIDQLMDFGWKRLVPLSLILFVLVAFAKVMVVCHVHS